MPNDNVDLTVHSTSLLGTGTLAANVAYSNDARHIALNITGAGNIVDIPLGSEPLRIKVYDMTNVIVWEWARGMAATKTIKTVTAGTTTVDTTSAIVVTKNQNGNYKASLSAALAANAALLVISIEE